MLLFKGFYKKHSLNCFEVAPIFWGSKVIREDESNASNLCTFLSSCFWWFQKWCWHELRVLLKLSKMNPFCFTCVPSRQEMDDILTVLTRVNREVSKGEYLSHKQMPQPNYTLTKKLVLKFVWPDCDQIQHCMSTQFPDSHYSLHCVCVWFDKCDFCNYELNKNYPQWQMKWYIFVISQI